MSQRNSEYARVPFDLYVTPQWVYDALYTVEVFLNPWDCAPVNAPFDFLQTHDDCEEIVTNPPFMLADAFVRRAIDRTRHKAGKVAMLLPHAWDTAQKRRDLFTLPFKAKYALTKRIRWENLEQKKNGPSTNHSWFVWSWKYAGPPTMGWLP